MIDIMESNYKDMKQSNDNLREDIETNSKLYSELIIKYKELTTSFENKEKDEAMLRLQYSELVMERDGILKDFKELLAINEEVTCKSSAEIANSIAVIIYNHFSFDYVS